MSLQTSGWVGHQFDDGVFGGKRVPSDPCFIIIFWAMPELVPRIFSCARKGDLQVKHDLHGLDQAQESLRSLRNLLFQECCAILCS